MRFHRYGSLNASHYKKTGVFGEFHTPPKKTGVFAFPIHIDDAFLWAWKFPRKDEPEEDSDKRFKRWAKSIHRTFEYEGDIWHHLAQPTQAVLARVGPWSLTDIKTYEKCFNITYAKDVGSSLKTLKEDLQAKSLPNRVRYNPYKPCPSIRISVDHLEVFIEAKDIRRIR